MIHSCNIEFSKFHGDELYGFITSVEQSFGITFADDELSQVATLNEFSDYLIVKLGAQETNDCTSQQAFYKFREAISEITGVNPKSVKPSTRLEEIVPEKTRRKAINAIENKLNIKLPILEAKSWVSSMFLLLTITGGLTLFFCVIYGFIIIALGVISLRLAYKYGKTFNLKTIGEVSEMIATAYYVQSRRSQDTFNKKEIKIILVKLLMLEMGFEKEDELAEYAAN